MTTPKLSKARRDALSSACWGLEHFSGCGTGRKIRRRDMVYLRELGLVRSIDAVKCDGDGWALEPERWCTAWQPTATGLEVALRLDLISDDNHKLLTDRLEQETSQ